MCKLFAEPVFFILLCFQFQNSIFQSFNALSLLDPNLYFNVTMHAFFYMMGQIFIGYIYLFIDIL